MKPRHFLTNRRVAGFLTIGALLVMGGTRLFMHLEGWSFVDAFYFTVSTVTTVGFGDLAVTHDASKLIATFYMLLTVPMLLVGIGLISEVMYGEHLEDVIHEAHSRKKKKKKK